MANLGEVFNTNDLPEGNSGFEPIPSGWYTVSITNASLGTTKARTGQYIKVRYDVTGPTHEGRVIFGNLNIRNQNPKAEEIGRQQLGDLLRAVGLPSLTDTDQLIGCACQVRVSIRKSEEYGDHNEVKGWKAINGAAAPAPAAPSAPSQPAAAGYEPPWVK